MFQPNTAYNDIPPLPPNVELESRRVLKACICARAALAELNQAGMLIPDQGMLVNMLPMLEARDSSAIENIVTTTDKLFRFSTENKQADPATKEALRHRTAMWAGVRSLDTRPMCTNTAVQICSTLKGRPMEIRRVPGTTIANAQTKEVVYTPPDGKERIRALLSNWEQFVHEESLELDPLVAMAVAHYQFEAIHPFTDGNGRTGRILNVLFLLERGLLNVPILYLSRYIVENKTDYYRLLNAVTRDGAWEEWLLYILRAVEETATRTRELVLEVREQMKQTASLLQASLPKIYSHELLQVLFAQPYCRIGNIVDAGIAKRQTASEYLKAIANLGVLKEIREGREKLFLNVRLMELLTR